MNWNENNSIINARQKIKWAKKEVMDLCLRSGYGHPSSAYSISELLFCLYYHIMRFDVNNPYSDNRDRLIISNNHASIMAMPYLMDLGFISPEDYQTIMVSGSVRTNHTNRFFPGMDFTGGALGIGLGISVGIAKAAQLNHDDYLTFCIVGDAESCEGSIWESVMFAGHNHLHNLIVIFDNNDMGVSDHTSNMITMEPIEDRWRAFGFETRRIDGHSINQIDQVFSDVRGRLSNKPLCIVADTIKGHGLPLMENKLMWHGTLPKGSDIALAYRQLREE